MTCSCGFGWESVVGLVGAGRGRFLEGETREARKELAGYVTESEKNTTGLVDCFGVVMANSNP